MTTRTGGSDAADRQVQENIKGAAANPMVTGVIWQQLLIFFVPLLAGTFFQLLYNTVDAIIVGRFVGKLALSAVGGATATLINLFVGLFVGITSGVTVVVSQFYGAKREKELQKAVHPDIFPSGGPLPVSSLPSAEEEILPDPAAGILRDPAN